MKAIEIQEKFIRTVVGSIDIAWNSIRIHYENFSIGGVVHEKFTSEIFRGEKAYDFDPPLQAFDLLIELRDALPDDQSGKWTSVDFFIEGTGKYKFSYGYGMPPMVENMLKLTAGSKER